MKNSKLVLLLGSTSVKKVNALKNAAKSIFINNEEIEVKSYEVESMINSQPIGYEENLQGAINRLENTKLKHINSNKDQKDLNYDYVVGIESGLVKVENKWLQTKDNPDPFQWIDIAFIVIEHKESGMRVVEQSASLEFPNLSLEKAKTMGFYKYVAGDFIERILKEEGVNCENLDSKDPHSFMTDNLFPRLKIIQNAIEIAFSRFIVKQRTKV